MSKRVAQSYTPEFRAEAIKLVLEQGFSVAEAAVRLSTNQGTLAYWVTQARKVSKNTPAKAGTPSASELMAEVRQLRKELAETRMERDILKKRRRTLPGSHCPVSVREAMAKPIPSQAAVPGSWCIPLWFLRLAEAASLPSHTGG